ncbi:MAG: transposase [Rhizobiales bacterium]|nr:transposase [Hyphomicrobiales bacterium]
MAGSTGRRRWPDDLKARIVAASFLPGARIADLARAHGTTRWQIYTWRRLARKGVLTLPAAVAETPAFAAVVMADAAAAEKAVVVVEIAMGDLIIRAPQGVDASHLARVIRAVRSAA